MAGYEGTKVDKLRDAIGSMMAKGAPVKIGKKISFKKKKK